MKYTLLLLTLVFSMPLLGQEDPETIFQKAIDQFVTMNMELSMEVQETDQKGRIKEKNFDVLMAKFGDVEKTRMVMQKPERAKGVTIIFTHLPDDVGFIEVFTPANGKTRKMKATPENVNRVGSNFSLSKYAYSNNDDFIVNLLGKQEVDGKPCYQLEVLEKAEVQGLKAEFIVEERSFHIVQILFFDADGNKTRTTNLSDFQPISGLKDKIQPMLILSEDIGENIKTRMQVLKITPRSDLKEEDFIIPGTSN